MQKEGNGKGEMGPPMFDGTDVTSFAYNLSNVLRMGFKLDITRVAQGMGNSSLKSK